MMTKNGRRAKSASKEKRFCFVFWVSFFFFFSLKNAISGRRTCSDNKRRGASRRINNKSIHVYKNVHKKLSIDGTPVKD